MTQRAIQRPVEESREKTLQTVTAGGMRLASEDKD